MKHTLGLNLKSIKLAAGNFYPMGAHWDGAGINFAVFSEDAQEIYLCLFDEDGREFRHLLPRRTNNIFHGYLPDAGPGLLYGFRAVGPYAPEQGLRFNHHKLLLDPYARHWVGDLQLLDSDFGYTIGHPDEDLSFDTRDNGAHAPRCQVVDHRFDWQGVRRPHTSWSDTVLYEAHVKGATKLNPRVPQDLRGRYLGLCSPAMIDHFVKLGVTAIELLPVHNIVHDRRLRELGLSNYWGYGNLGYFRPEHSYAIHDPIVEFKTMVRELHRAGLEVILDVVYNHTGEGSHLGPTLSFRGLCNRSYYRLDPQRPRFHRDYTGCGNTVNVDHPQVLQWVMDSLRFWVEEMQVDGFRYDLATALARHGSSFLDAVHQDPVLKTVKLIAEPWDLGEGGYQAGNFPAGWAEWNDRFRDTARRFWRGDGGQLSHLAERITGSGDLFRRARRGPLASINFVTCHDGFTMKDLVSYNHKHNRANGEDNWDGSNTNHSCNYGFEGYSEDPQLRRLRTRQIKNFLATLLLSVGVPMILGGDEFGHSQQGNNNAYCQDNLLSWLDWRETQESAELLNFARHLARLRQKYGHFRRATHPDSHEATWLHPCGKEMQPTDWHHPASRCVGLFLHEKPQLLLLFNAEDHSVEFRLDKKIGKSWTLVTSTDTEGLASPGKTLKPRAISKSIALQGRTFTLLERI